MSLHIRTALISDLDRIDMLFNESRRYMAAQGNSEQWVEGRPNKDTVRPDVEKGLGLVCCTDDGTVVCFFVLSDSEPAYDQIKDQWSSSDPYVVLHRFTALSGYGAGNFVMRYIQSKYTYIRLDTYKKNKTMLHLVEKYGFKYVGDVEYDYRPYDGRRMCFDWHGEQKTTLH